METTKKTFYGGIVVVGVAVLGTADPAIRGCRGAETALSPCAASVGHGGCLPRAGGAGVIGYVTYTQLVSADGPYRLFSKTATLLQHNAQVVHLLGAPVRVNANGPGRTVRYGGWPCVRIWEHGARFSGSRAWRRRRRRRPVRRALQVRLRRRGRRARPVDADDRDRLARARRGDGHLQGDRRWPLCLPRSGGGLGRPEPSPACCPCLPRPRFVRTAARFVRTAAYVFAWGVQLKGTTRRASGQALHSWPTPARGGRLAIATAPEAKHNAVGLAGAESLYGPRF